MATKADIVNLKDSYSKYIVSPLAQFGFGGFVFDVKGDEQIELQAEITDHYIEDNTVINDAMAVRPLRINLKNYVGELVYQDETDVESEVNKVATKLTAVSAFITPIGSAFNSLKSISEQDSISFEENSEDLADLWALTKNLNPQATRQQQAYLYFKSVQKQKILIAVQTPYEYLQNMVVESVIALQKEDSEDISEFSLTLKQVSFADVEFTDVSDKVASAITKAQKEVENVVGRTQGKIQSLALDLFEGLF
jgi:hypothetical protein